MQAYTAEDVDRALEQAGIQAGDSVYLQVSLGRLGRCAEGSTFPEVAGLLLRCLEERLGPGGTVFTPCHSYSIGRGEVYDPQHSPSRSGEFGEYFRLLPGSLRSEDPMVACTGRGPGAADLFAELPPTCFGQDSFFDRFRKRGGKLLMVGLGLSMTPFLHHMEELWGAPYRFLKRFHGNVRHQEKDRKVHWDFFASPPLPQCRTDGTRLEEAWPGPAIPLGRATLVCANVQELFHLAGREMARDPWFLAAGPPMSEAELLQAEATRLGFAGPSRSPGSPELELLLQSLKFSLEVEWRQTGQTGPLGPVPEAWNQHQSLLLHDGQTLAEGLPAAPYSLSIEEEMKGSRLIEHLSDREPLPNLLRKRSWTLGCPSELLSQVHPERLYRVLLRTTFAMARMPLARRRLDHGDLRVTLLGNLCGEMDGVMVGCLLADQFWSPQARLDLELCLVPGEPGLHLLEIRDVYVVLGSPHLDTSILPGRVLHWKVESDIEASARFLSQGLEEFVRQPNN